MKTVLVIEDETLMRDLMERDALAAFGDAVVHLAANFAAGLTWLCDNLAPDWVILDPGLPDVPRETVVEQTKAASGEAKIVVLTGALTPRLERIYLDQGAWRVLEKVDVTSQAIRAVIDGTDTPPPNLDPITTRITGLTATEQAVWTKVQEGKRKTQIAGEMGLSPDTVKTHLRNIRAKGV